MELTKSSEGEVTTLKLAGEIDLHASPSLRSELQTCARDKVPRLLLDFTDVEYIDSSGLATLIEYLRAAGPHGGKIALFGLQEKVRTIFDLVRLGELFSITETRDQALASA